MSLGTRAVSIVIAPGTEWTAPCPGCDERVKYTARHKARKVICNLYATPEHHRLYEQLRQDGETDAQAPVLPPGVGGAWDRVETWHLECYEIAGSPYGEAVERKAPQKPPTKRALVA